MADDSTSFKIPEKVEEYQIPGYRMRGKGADLAEIMRSGDSYHLRTELGGEYSMQAKKILKGHVAAAIAVAQGDQQSNQLVKVHSDQENKLCSCQKRGFRDLAFASISRGGVATVMYRCIFCNSTDTFKVDHSG